MDIKRKISNNAIFRSVSNQFCATRSFLKNKYMSTELWFTFASPARLHAHILNEIIASASEEKADSKLASERMCGKPAPAKGQGVLEKVDDELLRGVVILNAQWRSRGLHRRHYRWNVRCRRDRRKSTRRLTRGNCWHISSQSKVPW